ncbi:TraR/DksA C4-type zinc finger protein [Sapientia aquatica]|uniref:TraR/DksA family transcriptional regulator n=1 Tax=Sapientia aquatica TaxID=1549640 RepID=A0A4R5W1N3_9BURK|nr:TraR/DksA C4-type zinc finger protein [Sapientia aquatica]TDK65992.1 TraR/DksA family transcriptional regulator [Sapientia aquatica]
MSDPLDIASEREQFIRQLALDTQRQRSHTAGKTAADSAEFCTVDECGAPIPEARRQAVPGCRHCVDCQQRLERQRTQIWNR